jgi:hypothetical protein
MGKKHNFIWNLTASSLRITRQYGTFTDLNSKRAGNFSFSLFLNLPKQQFGHFADCWLMSTQAS